MNTMYSITEYNSVQILTVNSLLDEWQNRQILKELDQKINFQNNPLIINLNQLALINSIGLNFLLSILSRVHKKNGQLILTNVSRRVQRMLDITKLTSVFVLKPTVEQAVENFSLELEVV